MGASSAVAAVCRGAIVAALAWTMAGGALAQAQTDTPADESEPISAPASSAEAQDDGAPRAAGLMEAVEAAVSPSPLALVVEADLDSLALRAAIAERLDRPLTSLNRAQAEPYGPSAVLTVSLEPAVGISVMLWERGIGTEILSTPALQSDDDNIKAAVALALALLQRSTRDQRAAAELEANPYLRKLPKARPRRPHISPVNPYYRPRRSDS